MTDIKGQMYFATPLSHEEDKTVFHFFFVCPEISTTLAWIRDPGVLILGDGFARWIPNSLYDDINTDEL